MNFEVRSYGWSKTSDFSLPAWSLSKGHWRSGFETLWGSEVASKVITRTDALPNLLKVDLHQTAMRQIIYIPHNLVHKNSLIWREFCDEFKLEYPMLDQKSDFSPLDKANNFPVLAVVLDKPSAENKISDLTVMIPHWESIGFLRLCLWSIKKHYQNNMPKILVIDDFSSATTYTQIQELQKFYTFQLIQIHRPNKATVADVGMLLDLGLEYVKTKYVCMLDADTVHISNKTYTEAFEFLTRKSVVSYGLDTGLARSYHDLGKLKRFADFYPYDISLPGVSTVTNNLFRVMRTMDALAVARSIQFSRQVERRKIRDQLGRLLRRISMLTNNNHIIESTKRLIKSKFLNSQFPSMPPTGDNGVSANHWMEENKMGLKMNTPIVSYGIVSRRDGICFQNIREKIVHIALSTRALSAERREIEDAGTEFYDAIQDIADNRFEESVAYEKVLKLSQNYKIDF
jgi:Glycosyl transferase family 2